MIRLELDKGFQKWLKDVELSQQDIKRVASGCMRESAHIMESELRSSITGSGLSSHLASEMSPSVIEESGDVFTAKVGYESTAYNPRNLSPYFKAMFANYGTPYRKRHGKERARGFVAKAKKKARPKIKKAQKAAFEKIIERLK